MPTNIESHTVPHTDRRISVRKHWTVQRNCAVLYCYVIKTRSEEITFGAVPGHPICEKPQSKHVCVINLLRDFSYLKCLREQQNTRCQLKIGPRGPGLGGNALRRTWFHQMASSLQVFRLKYRHVSCLPHTRSSPSTILGLTILSYLVNRPQLSQCFRVVFLLPAICCVLSLRSWHLPFALTTFNHCTRNKLSHWYKITSKILIRQSH